MKPNLVDLPWGDIDGERVSVDGTPVSVIEEHDVAHWLAYGDGASGSNEVCIAELHDGRIVAWSTWSDVTGSGFHADAYGGNAELLFAASVEAVLPFIPEQDRETLKWFTKS